jgi:ankyrin repeat protein
MYITKRGADLERVDIYGNTPLGVAMLYKHYNYGIIMIQKNADVKKLIHPEDHEKIKKMFKKQAREESK